MLHWSKISDAIDSKSDQFFAQSVADNKKIKDIWHKIAHDKTLAAHLSSIKTPFAVPEWQGIIGAVIPIEPVSFPIQVVSVDGSQIYPDRHHGIDCYLINIGTVMIPYGFSHGIALDTHPYVFGIEKSVGYEHFSTDLVNAQRQELELFWGLTEVMRVRSFVGSTQAPTVVFCDGSFIVWLLESTNERLRTTFCTKYHNLFEQLYQNRVLIAGYISVPHSRELLTVVRLVAADYDATLAQNEYQFPYATDITVVQCFLPKQHRTTLFRHTGPLATIYPTGMHPHFFYVHTPAEIVRIEIPEWIAHNEHLVNLIASVAHEQAVKGNGYPVVLAEAHEMAVVTAKERDFFYHMVKNIATQKGFQTTESPKLTRKRIITV